MSNQDEIAKYGSVLSLVNDKLDEVLIMILILIQATKHIVDVRNILDSELRVVIGESYQRAYFNLILLQQVIIRTI